MARRAESIGYCIESSFDTAGEALNRERYLVKRFGRHDLGTGPLANQTDGGEEGGNWSAELLERKRFNLGGVNADDEERRIANRFFHQLCSVASVPIKPLSRFRPERLHANRNKLAMSIRQAAALAGSAIVSRVLLKPGAVIPRRIVIDDVAMCIENGVGRDVLSSQMARLESAVVGAETLALTKQGLRFIITSIGNDALISAGVLMPDQQR